MNPSGIPARVRLVAYYLFAVGSVALTYAASKGWVGADELTAWAALAAVFGIPAGANVSGESEGRHRR